ncbi:MAG TPA: threonine-phosphate decarboxylase CobD [Clostridia bacterium]
MTRICTAISEKRENPHGGDIYSAAKLYGYNIQDILDFSANINPLGVPKGLKEKIISSIDSLVNYPDTDCRVLKEAISKYLNITYDNIIPGNGASELIYLLFEVLSPKKVVIPAPSFCEYAKAAGRYGSLIHYIRLKEENDFRLDIDELINNMPSDTDAVMLCNPNNPTSTLASKDDLKHLIEYAREKNIYVIVDEAFIELTEGSNDNSIVRYVKDYDNLFVLRAFTKIFAIPGLRLGYLIGNREKINLMWDKKIAWSVNSLALCVGEYLGESCEYLQKTQEWLSNERLWFYLELSRIHGIKVFKPSTNFILIKLLDLYTSSSEIKESLAKRGILIRNADNFEFLNDRSIRIAIKDRESNIKFLDTFESVIKELWKVS